MITFDQVVRVPPDVMMREVGGEAVILNLDTEVYYGLDDIGTRMWTLLTESATIEQAFEALLAEYEVDADTLRRDLTTLIEALSAQGLITLDHV